MEIMIERPLSPDELRSGMVSLGSKSVKDYVRDKVIKKEQEMVLAHKPFCSRCARLDLVEKAERKVKNSQEFVGESVDGKSVKKVIDDENLDFYGLPDRFETIKTADDYADKLVDGLRTNVLIGHHVDYRCKVRGCGITVFYPKEVVKEKR